MQFHLLLFLKYNYFERLAYWLCAYFRAIVSVNLRYKDHLRAARLKLTELGNCRHKIVVRG